MQPETERKNFFRIDFFFYSLVAGIIFLFTFLIDFNGLYGQDSHEYFRYAKSLNTFFCSGKNPRNFFWPLLYPVAGALAGFLFSVLKALQLISIFSLTTSAFFLEKILLKQFDASKFFVRAIVTAFYIFSPFLFRLSLTVMSDSLAILLITLCVFYFQKIINSGLRKYFFPFLFFGSCACMTRYGCALPVLVLIAAAGVRVFNKISVPTLLVAFLMMLIPVVPHLILRWQNPATFLNHPWLAEWNSTNFFKRTFETPDGNAHYLMPNFLFSLSNFFQPGVLFPGILLLLFSFPKLTFDFFSKTIYYTVFIYVLFLSGIPYQNPRFLLLTFPLVIIILFPAFIKLRNFRIRRVMKYVLLVLVCVIQFALCYRALLPFFRDNKIEREIADSVKQSPQQTIYTFSILPALESYGVKKELISLYDKKIDSAKANSLLLFNEKQFAVQWKNKLPMINFEYFKSHYQLNSIATYPDGWELYEIKR